ncbi:putative E3 ubiquitin-protein ligase RHB1A [Canna indica]|uniref:RING-type E3 ubiquitin transferase n=1 Tax=Canna indica TaxID=4628 RepID=A0AAQ3QMB3_9LILI|nr:putative E3 ubiquitin-protein ligase RHB1A [Canna indica]
MESVRTRIRYSTGRIYYCKPFCIFLQFPQDLEEHEPLSSTSHGTLSAISSGLLIDTNLDTSTPDTYRAPPVPLPYDVGLANSQTVPRGVESCDTKTDHIHLANSQTTEETTGRFETSDCKNKTESEHNSSKITEDDVSKPIISHTDEEDVCPICLEEYDSDNPLIMTKCEHHFHLSCILEWMERSDTCAICDKVMMIDNTYNTFSVSSGQPY